MNSFRSLAPCLVFLALAIFSAPIFSQVSISIDVAPPPLVVEDQPPCPDDGVIWTPGYWSYDQDGGEYYWVAGSWEQPPQPELLWTPAYWAWDGNNYAFYPGYWGPTVGFYGGVNYGHGYWGNGYGGGRWDNGHFDYNTAANNVAGGHVHNTYADNSSVRAQSSRVSFNGGHGGLTARPTQQEQQAGQQSHVQATAQQQAHFQTASQQRSHQVKVNSNANKPAAAAPGIQPGSAAQPGGQPEVKPQGESQFTGDNSQVQKHDETLEKKAAPTEPQHDMAPEAQNKPEVKPDTVNDQHVEQHLQNPIQPEQKAPQMSDHTVAPESHPMQSPGNESHDKPAAAAPGVQQHAPTSPQQQPHADAKPQGNGPAPAPSGGGNGQPDNKQH